MNFCPRYVGVAWAHQPENKALLTRLRCGLWSCPYCSRKNQSIWRAFLLNKLPNIASDWYLLTLTAHSRLRSRGQSLENIRSNIDRLMKRLHRTFGEFYYVPTYETHPSSDAVHAHLIVSNLSSFVVHGFYRNGQRGFLGVMARPYYRGCWSLNSYIKIISQECNMGYIADCRALTGDPSFAVHYVCKYLTKDLQSIECKGLRHVQTSRGIGSPSVASEYNWQVGAFVTVRDFVEGEELKDLQTGEVLLPEYWNDSDVYPYEMM